MRPAGRSRRRALDLREVGSYAELVRSFAAVFALTLAACGNTKYTAADTPEDPDAAASDGGSAGCSNACPPDACGLVRLACGSADCGSCANPLHKCVDGKCACVPKTCQELGAQCGAVADGCGGEVFCGVCMSSSDGGAGDGGDAGAALSCGASNLCSTAPCVPKSASVACFDPSVRLCGKHPDGCGGIADCGTSACSGTGETCGGGGKAGQCGCTPQQGCYGSCYSLCPDGCGGMKRCSCNNCH